MRRRPNALPLAATIALFALFAIIAPGVAFAQDLSGTYRVTTDQTTVQIPEWGSDCGPRPSSRTGNTGREATVTSDGAQLTIQDGRHRNRTDGCWSDNPRARRISASHTGNRWTVICQTPDEDYQHEQGTYTITVDGARITMRESTEYAWQLRESRCRASASRTLTYERTSGAAATPPQDAGTAHATNTPPPPTNRCANPGAPARLSLSPSRRSLAPGGRGCFRARFYDLNGCEVTSGLPPVTWSMTRSGAAGAIDASMENGCVRAPAGMTVAEYNVTASAGPLSAAGVAAVVSAEELRNLVAANFEDEEADAGVQDAGPAVAPSGSGVGAVVVTPPPTPSAESHGLGAVLWILMGIGGLLAVAGVVLLTTRRKPARTSRAPSERLSELQPMAPKELPRAKKPIGEAPPMQPVVAPPMQPPASSQQPPMGVASPFGSPAAPPVAAHGKGAGYVQASRPLVKKCPVCNQRFTAENAFCPEHGTALVMIESQPVSHATMIAGTANAGSATLCPRCGQPVDPGAQFCPRDGTPVLAPPAPALPLVCPRCQRRFPEGTAFCGDDGSPLRRG
jgi:hypothetical protein